MIFDDLVGKTVGFLGVYFRSFALCYEGKKHAFTAVEDEKDGHRSMLDEVKPCDLAEKIFFSTQIAYLEIRKEDSIDLTGYCLVDGSGHKWLEFGTNYSDDYYPLFVFEYDPPKTELGTCTY